MRAMSLAVALLSLVARAEDAKVVQVGLSLSGRGLLGLAEGGVRKVFVTIESDQPLTELHRLTNVASGYVQGGFATIISTERICRAPCNELVDVSEVMDFYIQGESMVGSGPLDLSQYGDSVKLKVHGGSRGRRIGGVALVAAGGGLALGGGLLAGLFLGLNGSDGTAPDSTLQTFGVGSLIAAGIGVALLIVGIILLPGSGTDVVMEPGPPPASVPPPQGPGIPPAPPGAPTSI